MPPESRSSAPAPLTPPLRRSRRRATRVPLWLQWLLATALGSATGLAIGLPFGSAAGEIVAKTTTLGWYGTGSYIAFGLVTLPLFGLFTGIAQSHVLRSRIRFPLSWVLATVEGWILVVPIGLVVAGIDMNFALFIFLLPGIGWLGGALAGLFQWWVLRDVAEQAGWWIPASALGWAVSYTAASFSGAFGPANAPVGDLMLRGAGGPGLTIFLPGLLVGLLGGAVTGAVLTWQLERRGGP